MRRGMRRCDDAGPRRLNCDSRAAGPATPPSVISSCVSSVYRDLVQRSPRTDEGDIVFAPEIKVAGTRTELMIPGQVQEPFGAVPDKPEFRFSVASPIADDGHLPPLAGAEAEGVGWGGDRDPVGAVPDNPEFRFSVSSPIADDGHIPRLAGEEEEGVGLGGIRVVD